MDDGLSEYASKALGIAFERADHCLPAPGPQRPHEDMGKGAPNPAGHRRRHRLIQSERRVVEPEAERTHGDPLSADRRDPVEVFGRDDPAGGEHRPVPAG